MSILLVILTAAALSIIQAAFLSTMTAPLSFLHLPLILVIGLVTGFRFRDAIVAALAGGFALDALTASGKGVAVVVMLVVAAALTALFVRVFSHLSVPSFIAINAAGFLLYHLFFLAAALVRGAVDGPVLVRIFAWDRLWVVCLGLLLQIAASGILLLAAKKMKKLFLSTFFVVR